MTETQTVGNGHSTTFSSGQKPTLEELERAKEILKAARKPSPKRKPGALPRLSAQGDRVKAEYHGSIDKNPVDWEAVENSQEFCLTPDGAGRMIKLDRRSAIDPATRRRVSAEGIRDGLINMGVVPHWADLAALILEAEIEASNRGEKVERSHTQQRVISLAWQQYETRAIHNPDT